MFCFSLRTALTSVRLDYHLYRSLKEPIWSRQGIWPMKILNIGNMIYVLWALITSRKLGMLNYWHFVLNEGEPGTRVHYGILGRHLSMFEIFKHRNIMWQSENQKVFRRPARRSEDNTDNKKGRIHRIQDRDEWRDLVSTVLNLRSPYRVENFFTIRRTISFWRTIWLL
jgi:hypothetical protein